MSSRINQYGLKNTPARGAILALLERARSPLPIGAIEKKLAGKDINQSTVYRTLNQFVEAGIAKRIDFGDGKAYFEIAHEGDHHHHIVCVKCKKTEDVELCDIEAAEKKIIEKSARFTEIRGHSLEFFGVCKECKNAV